MTEVEMQVEYVKALQQILAALEMIGRSLIGIEAAILGADMSSLPPSDESPF